MQVANSLAEASKVLANAEGSLELRQIQALLDISKEESAMVIIYPMGNVMGASIASAAAGTQTKGPQRKKVG